MTHLTSQLRVLTLNEGANLETTVFRLEKGWILHFVLGPSLATKKVRLFTNHPVSGKDGPNRHQFRELAWRNYSLSKWDVYDNYCELPIVMGGSFNYFLTIDGSDDKANEKGCGYFLVDPSLLVGKYDEKLPLNSITCQTVLGKCLGPLPGWIDKLRVSKETGYNMVHFTPLQELGASNSAYCIADQFKLNPVFCLKGKAYTFEDVAKIVDYMKQEWEVLSLVDLVFNHTANESPWIQTHPECVYNLVNSPHLKPAYLLDRILWKFSLEVANDKWIDHGLPAEVRTEDHLICIGKILRDLVIPKYNLHEFYVLDLGDIVNQFRTAVLVGQSGRDRDGKELQLIPDPKYRRKKAAIDMPLALHLFNTPKPDAANEEQRIEWCCGALRYRLEQLNQDVMKTVGSHLEAAINNYMANARWRFVQPDGEKIKRVSVKEPLMYNYFVIPKGNFTVEQEEEIIHTDMGAYCMAHNGWVMDDDPLKNFAEPGSNVYLRRELMPWGDSVKLRYGKGPEDVPYLWQHMRNYAAEAARIFHGVRLDNCHSTPIHVAEYMLDEARKVRPDLYVIAELFTSSETKDNIFINRLGINSLIREALAAWDSHEQGRLVHRYGGYPVGAFMQPPARPLVKTRAHAMFFDQTHDNQCPIEKRSVYDILPSAGLVAMTCCASGSNRGYDELVNHHIHVVKEARTYTSWTEQSQSKGLVDINHGIIAAKKALNKLHVELGNAGFNQVFVDQVDSDIVSVTRHNPVSHQSVILIAHTAFHKHMQPNHRDVKSVFVPGVINEVILEARLDPKKGPEHTRDPHVINGLTSYKLHMKQHFDVKGSGVFKVRTQAKEDVPSEQFLEFIHFPPGSIVAFKVSLNSAIKSAIMNIRSCLTSFGYRVHTYSGRNLAQMSSTTLESVVTGLSLNDMNRVLYSCDPEETDDGKGFGAYNLPGYGSLNYCGIQGIMSVLSKIRAHNDLGHPLCNNLREGDWMFDYMSGRLLAFPGTAKLGGWFAHIFSSLKQVPRYLIPSYFDAIVTGVHMLVEEVAWAKMCPFVRNGSTFVRHLSMGSLQFCNVVKTASLPILSPALAPPFPPTQVNDKTGESEQACVTLAAGLPHFSSGIFRNWGRDTFISLRGLMLLTGRYDESRFIILAFAGTLRHGLIPNLLGSGIHARYNCRDAFWWWLQCIKDYTIQVPNGEKILNDKVSRLYPSDDSEPQPPGKHDQTLAEVIQEGLERHAEGVKYRERNAGPAIDSDMSNEGFNVEFGVDWETGFVYGGSEHNCGTWMDKNGSSDVTGNKGKPATPRDGSAVELVGLSMSTVQWLGEMNAAGLYHFTGVTRKVHGKTEKITFSQWADLIKANFELYFWINTTPLPQNEPKPKLIHKRGIYKDSHGATQFWSDYQLRPNFPIAIVVAPEMVTPERAWEALNMAEKCLLAPLGMRTLDPSDWAYNGNYVNSDKSRGYNYHQGPEWVWPVGYFLRAKLATALRLESSRPGIVQQTVDRIKNIMCQHNVSLQASDWKSLPELTNKDGAVCYDSCAAQAWSMGCLLEVLYDLEKLANN